MALRGGGSGWDGGGGGEWGRRRRWRLGKGEVEATQGGLRRWQRRGGDVDVDVDGHQVESTEVS